MRRLGARDYARLPTERPNPRTRHIDLRRTLDIVRAINAEDSRVPTAVGAQARSIAAAVDIIALCLRAGGSALFIGAGTSGRLAVLEAAECPPTFNTRPDQIRAVMAGGKSSVFRSKEGAEDDPSAGRRAVRGLGYVDAVIGVAASGVTPFVRGALKEARKNGAATVLVTSNGTPPDNPAELLIAVEVGPEVVAGSTRLKSGTAAKLVLNMLTTGAMIKLGKVYDHWMVDLKPSSRKLRLRGERIVADLGGVSAQRAKSLFRVSGGSVQTAVVMARRKVGAAEARALLRGRSLREALG